MPSCNGSIGAGGIRGRRKTPAGSLAFQFPRLQERGRRVVTAIPYFDAAVIGLGAMGCAALESLARRGCRVVGIERFAPGHDRGSSHGATRIIRLGYFEHPSYVPLLRAAYPLWRDLEARSGEPLLTVTGIVEIGTAESEVVAGTLRSSRLHGLAHEVLDARSLMARFPAFRLPDDFIGVFQPDGGFLRAEPAVAALLALARNAGAHVRAPERVLAVERRPAGVRIATGRGDIDAACVIVTAGPWLKSLLPELAVPIRVTRQVLGWFAPRQASEAALFAPGRFPVFLLQNPDGIFYGFPADHAGAIKLAKHYHFDETVDPDRCERNVSAADQAAIRAVAKSHLPGADGRLVAATTCLYTMTPDADFILDRLPGHPRIIVASPCSGHGFKFAPVIGEILADLAISGTTAHDISRFSLARFR
jgi:sarcosine oxidase